MNTALKQLILSLVILQLGICSITLIKSFLSLVIILIIQIAALFVMIILSTKIHKNGK